MTDVDLLLGLLGDSPISVADLACASSEELLPRVLASARAAGVIPMDINLDDVQRRLAIYRANVEALQAYRGATYRGRTVLLSAMDRRPDESARQRSSWAELTGGGLEVVTVPGNHMSMIREPDVRSVVQELRDQLARASPTSLERMDDRGRRD